MRELPIAVFLVATAPTRAHLMARAALAAAVQDPDAASESARPPPQPE